MSSDESQHKVALWSVTDPQSPALRDPTYPIHKERVSFKPTLCPVQTCSCRVCGVHLIFFCRHFGNILRFSCSCIVLQCDWVDRPVFSFSNRLTQRLVSGKFHWSLQCLLISWCDAGSTCVPRTSAHLSDASPIWGQCMWDIWAAAMSLICCCDSTWSLLSCLVCPSAEPAPGRV